MIITGEKFVLRPFTMQDVPAVAKYANNKAIADNLRDVFPHPYSEQDAEEFIRYMTIQSEPMTHFAIDIDGEAVGTIGIFLKSDVYRKNAEIGYWLAEPFWGKGIITEVIKLIVAYAFATFDLVRIYAEPFATNVGSIRALEKAGFVREALLRQAAIKNDVLLDSTIYARLKP
ncbi:Protein N-acetyltransferase, RimJ/RimL family [Catalinimonas alkaloidigena]|uniref:Protein N-acetyltransferase, RimJ/RimL family n=1 Tax=Catalinimonas alkaloidigena TaxID=1075417 RepID=A0A1G9LQ15_9BACT|nr:GNAT family protein [Catalinimonas alkaloidigena]SDL64020.1 Protein N-acetyltransferase, RimJ/RimL family [Catalinimonas alkaloidigena]